MATYEAGLRLSLAKWDEDARILDYKVVPVNFRANICPEVYDPLFHSHAHIIIRTLPVSSIT